MGDLVLLKAENYNLSLPSLKLSPRWLGPFKTLAKKGTNTVALALPKRLSRVETIQNVSWLKPYKSRPADLGPAVVRPTPEVVGDHVEDEVEVILADRYKGKIKLPQLDYPIRMRISCTSRFAWPSSAARGPLPERRTR